MIRSIALAALAISSTAFADPPLRMNQIQVIGTHNSYHQRPDPKFLEIAKAVVSDAEQWDYSHAPLPVQLDRNVRSFELDLHNFGNGYQVLHVPNFDKESSCPVFIDCLTAVKEWSDAHPRHVPLSFLLEIKEAESRFSSTPPIPINRPELEDLDAAIRSIFPPDRLIEPDDIRGDSSTLEEAILTKGWPELDTVRGQVMFILHEDGRLRDVYTEGRQGLQGCAMFVESSPGEPFAATLIMNDPDNPQIAERIRKGYFVRTRADSGLSQGRRNATERRDTALASGANVVTTDFPTGEADPTTGYVVALPNEAPARCNPVNAPESCAGITE